MVDAPPPEGMPPARRTVRLPPWLAVVLVSFVTAGLGWGGWKLMGGGEKPVDPTQYESNDTGRGGFNPPRLMDVVTLNPDGTGIARTAAMSVRFNVDKNGKPTAMVTGAIPRNLIPEDRQAVVARLTAINNANARRAAGVSDIALAKLRSIQLPEPPVMSPETTAELLKLWSQYRAAGPADRAPIETKLLDLLRQTTSANTNADAKAYHAAAEAIRGVLTPDQIARLRRPAPPTTRTAPPRPATSRPINARSTTRPATRRLL